MGLEYNFSQQWRKIKIFEKSTVFCGHISAKQK